jgi:hypothetical protein
LHCKKKFEKQQYQLISFFHKTSLSQKTVLLVVFFTLLRVVLSFFIDLGNDESYYWTYFKNLQWNYFDHPPLVALWARLFTINGNLPDSAFFLRLGSIAGAAIASLFIYKTMVQIDSKKAAFIAVLLYNTSFYAGFTSGILLIPDAPQMVFFTGSMFLITKICKDENNWFNWFLFGLCTGLCIMSKMHGCFLWFGMILFAIIHKRHWLLKFPIYLSVATTLIVVSPILFWNIQYDFITWRFHSERVEIHHSVIQWVGFLKELTGEFLLNNPVNVVLITIFLFIKRPRVQEITALKIFKLIGFPFLILPLLLSLFRDTFPHWNGPAYIILIPIAAIGISRLKKQVFTKMLPALFVFTLCSYILLLGFIQYYPGTIGSHRNFDLGKGDLSLDAYGWTEAGKEFRSIYEKETRNQTGNRKPPLICNYWWGAHVEYHFARPLSVAMIGLGRAIKIHQYYWSNQTIEPVTNMDTAFCVIPSHDYYDIRKANAQFYSKIDSVTVISIYRNRKPAQNFFVYKLIGWKGKTTDSL